jgi:hypothetical protein
MRRLISVGQVLWSYVLSAVVLWRYILPAIKLGAVSGRVRVAGSAGRHHVVGWVDIHTARWPAAEI